MMKEIIDELSAVRRRVGPGTLAAGAAHTLTLRRTYDAPVEDVWDAITTRERISRWFLPISGDLRLGGRYQLEGNAGGEILHCEPPHTLKVTWGMGEGDPSEVEVRLSGTGDATELVLEHTAIVPPEMWDTYGPGAVGVGWDLALLGLALYVRGQSIEESEREAWSRSDEARAFMTDSAAAWAAAHEEAGATPEQASTGAKHTTEFYAPSQ
jgi:uncharacterized protein YndB with AHSA1/START domain